MQVKDDISAQLDLGPFLTSFSYFLSREKPFFIEGDQNRHFSLIKELDNIDDDESNWKNDNASEDGRIQVVVTGKGEIIGICPGLSQKAGTA